MGMMRDRMSHAVAAALLVAAMVTGCGKEAEEAALGTTKESALEPREVAVTKVARRGFNRSFRATGFLMPTNQARLRALVEGPLETVLVDIGDRVKEGQPLFEIRKIDAELALQSAEAAQGAAEASLRDLKAWRREEEVASLQAQLARARSEFERQSAERERARVLYERKSISPSEWDAVRTAAEAAEEGMRAAEAQVKMATTGPTPEQIGVAQAQVNTAATGVAQARQMLLDTTVAAPYEGVITGKFRKPGDFVRRGEEVLEITALAALEAEMNVPERFSGQVEAGLPVNVVVESIGVTRPGVVTAVNQSIDLQTRTFLVKVEVDNSDFKIKSGAFATAVFDLPAVKNALAVPMQSVISLEGQSFLWVVRDGKAYRVPVTIGAGDEAFVEVQQGAEEGAVVVVEGMGALAEGDPVKATEWVPKAEPAAKAPAAPSAEGSAAQ